MEFLGNINLKAIKGTITRNKKFVFEILDEFLV